MCRFHRCVLTLSLMLIVPEIAIAGPFSIFKSRSNKNKSTAGPVRTADPFSTSTKSRNQRVAEQVAAALRAAKLNGYDIQIEFKNGEVTLQGRIATSKQRKKATQVAKIPGVRKVNNRLALIKPSSQQTASRTPPSREKPTRPKHSRPVLPKLFKKTPVQQAGYETDRNSKSEDIRQIGATGSQRSAKAASIQSNQQVAEKIALSLKSANLNGYDIEVRYQHGTALLTGSVADLQQKARATEVISRIPAVKNIDNRLTTRDQVAAGPPPNSSAAFGPSVLPISAGRQPGYPGAMRPPMGYPIAPIGYQPANNGPPMPPQPGAYSGRGPGAPGIPAPPNYGHPGQGASHTVYNMPNMPNHAWPTYANYPNYAQVSYPKQYSASAWPYIGPFYPYPQIPMGWRKVQLEWDDGYWNLNFNPKTDKWFWFMNPKYW